MRIFDFLKGNKPDGENKANVIISHNPPEFDTNTILLDLTAPSIRDQFVLLLIAKTNMNNPRTLGLRLDMCDFPGNESKSISNLIDSKLIYYSKTNGFGHPIKYAATSLGEDFLKNHISHHEIINHVKQMVNPDFMLELVQTIFGKMKSKNSAPPVESDRSNWTGKDFEFLITGDLEITAENHDQIMTPNSFEWAKIEKDNWPYYQVGQDEFSYSWEPPGIQMTFNDDITFQKAKNIADEIIGNIEETGQSAELVILKSGKIFKF